MGVFTVTQNQAVQNGGLIGPLTVKCRGFMFLGAYEANLHDVVNVLVRVHTDKPLYPVIAGPQTRTFADGIPLTVGQWFKLSKNYNQWYFSVRGNLDVPNPVQYLFWTVDDDCFFGGSLNMALPVVD